MQQRDRFFIDGRWVPPAATGQIEVVDPATEAVCGVVSAGGPEDVDRAVTAARRALPSWAATSLDERGKALGRLRDALAARQQEIAQVISMEMGAPIKMAAQVQVGLPLAVLGSYVELLPSITTEETVGNSLVVRDPVGVVAAITPWNYPLHQVIAKVAPALAAGCPVVLKPSELAPLCSFLLADIVEEVGLPPGVFNLVSGFGPAAGEPLAAHPDVDLVSFTGSVPTGRRISELAAATIKRVTLELGGKSANVVLPDVHGELLQRAVQMGLYHAYYNSGQTCTAWTRMLLPANRVAEALSYAVAGTESYRVGDPRDENTQLGPLVSDRQKARVLGYVEKGVDEGARLVTGGVAPPPGLARGYYVRPTVFADVRTEMTVAQEEIFGPVLSVLTYADEEEAVRIANDTVYGLSGGVWSADQEHAVGFARRLRTGQVIVNGGAFNVRAPFGGFKQSGHGRELGRYGLQEYQELKSLQL